jgi:hypothetical protein
VFGLYWDLRTTLVPESMRMLQPPVSGRFVVVKLPVTEAPVMTVKSLGTAGTTELVRATFNVPSSITVPETRILQ